MNEATKLLAEHAGITLAVLSALVMALIIGHIALAMKWSRFNKSWKALLVGNQSGNLERLLLEHLRAIMTVDQRLNKLESLTTDHTLKLSEAIRGVGMVKYDAFDDVGGEQSFALALLNEKEDGLIITTMYGRLEQRTYAKRIERGASRQQLTDEEKKALAIAKRSITTEEKVSHHS